MNRERGTAAVFVYRRHLESRDRDFFVFFFE